MASEKSICLSIFVCQLTAILSGCFFLYLFVIVVSPSRRELALNFNNTPIMCTTTHAVDLLAKGRKANCDWTTCGEWCLSKGGAICMQIMVRARHNGSRVNFRNCVDISDNECSALDVNVTHTHDCKKGECKDLTGLYTCKKEGDNPCTYISPAFVCQSRNIDRNQIVCTEESCKDRLVGVYTCRGGKCQKLTDIKKYYLDCERKCTHLEMSERNVVIFSNERLVTTACSSMDTPDNNSIAEISSKQEWRDKKQALLLYCTYLKRETGTRTYDLITSDCFNASIAEVSDFQHIRTYMDMLKFHQILANNTEDWAIVPEKDLTILNNTKLKINPDGCVNTLKKECTAFFNTHAHDGFDGMTPDRFPCYITDQTTEYVIGVYDPELSEMLWMLASMVPGFLFLFACFCLFLCSKSVDVGDDGHLKLAFLKGNKEPVQFDELL